MRCIAIVIIALLSVNGCTTPTSISQKQIPTVTTGKTPPEKIPETQKPKTTPPTKPQTPDNKDRPAVIPADFPIPIHNATQRDWEIIRDTLEGKSDKLIRSIKSITIHADNADHHFEPSHAAHCEPEAQLCFLRKFMTPSIIRHEAMHALEKKFLDKDIRQWREITGEDEYVKLAKLPDNAFPLQGIIIKRGSENYSEDMGEWVEAIVRCRQGLTHPFLKIQKGDPRYLQKLIFLYEKEAITDAEYKEISAYMK